MQTKFWNTPVVINILEIQFHLIKFVKYLFVINVIKMFLNFLIHFNILIKARFNSVSRIIFFNIISFLDHCRLILQLSNLKRLI